MSDTFVCKIHKARKGLWAFFFLIVLFGCWLAGQANSDHVITSDMPTLWWTRVVLFTDTIRCVSLGEEALLVPRKLETFPENTDRLEGHVDVWWIVHDGGMMILLVFLLLQHKVWRRCKLRIFTVARILQYYTLSNGMAQTRAQIAMLFAVVGCYRRVQLLCGGRMTHNS